MRRDKIVYVLVFDRRCFGVVVELCLLLDANRCLAAAACTLVLLLAPVDRLEQSLLGDGAIFVGSKA